MHFVGYEQLGTFNRLYGELDCLCWAQLSASMEFSVVITMATDMKMPPIKIVVEVKRDLHRGSVTEHIIIF